MTDKQPEALRLADDLDFGPHSLKVEFEAAALLRAQHEAIERKDALLRQALEAMKDYFDHDKFGLSVKAMQAITKELQ